MMSMNNAKLNQICSNFIGGESALESEISKYFNPSTGQKPNNSIFLDKINNVVVDALQKNELRSKTRDYVSMQIHDNGGQQSYRLTQNLCYTTDLCIVLDAVRLFQNQSDVELEMIGFFHYLCMISENSISHSFNLKRIGLCLTKTDILDRQGKEFINEYFEIGFLRNIFKIFDSNYIENNRDELIELINSNNGLVDSEIVYEKWKSRVSNVVAPEYIGISLSSKEVNLSSPFDTFRSHNITDNSKLDIIGEGGSGKTTLIKLERERERLRTNIIKQCVDSYPDFGGLIGQSYLSRLGESRQTIGTSISSIRLDSLIGMLLTESDLDGELEPEIVMELSKLIPSVIVGIAAMNLGYRQRL